MTTVLAVGVLSGTALLVGGLSRPLGRPGAALAQRRRDLLHLVSFVADSSAAPTRDGAIDAAAAQLVEVLHLRSVRWEPGAIADDIEMCLYPDGTVTQRLASVPRRLALCVVAGGRTYGHFEALVDDPRIDIDAQLMAGAVLGHLAALLATLPDRQPIDNESISRY